MKLKSNRFKTSIHTILIPFLLIVLTLTGCSATNQVIEKEINPNINVLGAQLNMPESKVDAVLGTKGEKAMCIYGYEYEYPDLRMNIGYDSNTGKVRRITTKNPDTSILGVTPGTELEEASETITSKGFVKDEKSKYIFYKEDIILTIISMKSTHADGITIEIKPE